MTSQNFKISAISTTFFRNQLPNSDLAVFLVLYVNFQQYWNLFDSGLKDLAITTLYGKYREMQTQNSVFRLSQEHTESRRCRCKVCEDNNCPDIGRWSPVETLIINQICDLFFYEADGYLLIFIFDEGFSFNT